MTERKVSLEQSLIAQEQELLNPPSDGPIPEFALYRALRMAELAILGELERLNSSHKLTGLQLEYKAVEIPDTVTEEESQRLYEEAKLYNVAIGKELINSANSGNISNSLETDVRDLLVERLYEYLNRQLLSVYPRKNLYLRLLINFSYPQPSVTESDNLRRREFIGNLINKEITNTNTLSFELLVNYDPSCGKVCNDGKPHLRINGECKC
ncbi:MAG: hypothetical protein HEQ10_06520 [Dolichospermum sp. DEX182a]|nr:hypothetical protein [Dolichospermum sp. DEX182a]